jgi:general secretion pathway protein H
VRRPHGFTLIEVMVVVVLVGIIAGAVMLSGGARGDGYQLREEADRLAAVVRLVADEAVLDGREYGLLVSTGGYQVWHFDPAARRWARAPDALVHRLPAAMTLSLQVEGSPVLLSAPVSVEHAVPQIQLSSSAQWTPFLAQLHLAGAQGRGLQVQGDGMNDPVVSPLDPR